MEGLASLGINVSTLLAQIVTFGVLFILLKMFAFKPILKMLDERSDRVKESMEQADYIKEQVANTEEESKARIEAAGKEGQELINRAVRAGDEVKQKAQQDARTGAESLLTKARTEIQRERDEAISELRKEVADLTITVAEKVIGQTLDKEAHRQLIDKTLDQSTTLRQN